MSGSLVWSLPESFASAKVQSAGWKAGNGIPLAGPWRRRDEAVAATTCVTVLQSSLPRVRHTEPAAVWDRHKRVRHCPMLDTQSSSARVAASHTHAHSGRAWRCRGSTSRTSERTARSPDPDSRSNNDSPGRLISRSMRSFCAFAGYGVSRCDKRCTSLAPCQRRRRLRPE